MKNKLNHIGVPTATRAECVSAPTTLVTCTNAHLSAYLKPYDAGASFGNALQPFCPEIGEPALEHTRSRLEGESGDPGSYHPCRKMLNVNEVPKNNSGQHPVSVPDLHNPNGDQAQGMLKPHSRTRSNPVGQHRHIPCRPALENETTVTGKRIVRSTNTEYLNRIEEASSFSRR
ncbi:MAG: hypothetical protein JSU94_00185 [Phycisphaerales bacterium]|nr:MAG: hypothetical protein JSU94_00185 [Phycisphaerales bacterium]